MDWVVIGGGPNAVFLARADFPRPGTTCLPYDVCRHAIFYCDGGLLGAEIGYLHMNDVIEGWRTQFGPQATIAIDTAEATLALDGMVLVARDNWRARLLPEASGALLAALPGAQTITITAPLYDIAMIVSDADRTLLAAFARRCAG